jgi:hypothetical protein
VSVTQTRAARAAAAAALAAYEFPALTFLSPALRRRLAIVDRIAGDRSVPSWLERPARPLRRSSSTLETGTAFEIRAHSKALTWALR